MSGSFMNKVKIFLFNLYLKDDWLFDAQVNCFLVEVEIYSYFI